MIYQEFNNQTCLFDLVSRYELLQRQGKSIYFNEDTYHRLIDYFEREFLFDKAFDVVCEAEQRYPYTVSFLLKKANLLVYRKEYDNALTLLERAASYNPSCLEVHLCRAMTFAKMGFFEESKQLLSNLKSNDSYQPYEYSYIYLYEALMLERMRRFEHMFYALKEAIKQDVTNEEALEKMWLCVENSSKHAESILLHEWVVREEPYSHWGWFNLANAYEYECNYEKAIEAYEFSVVIKDDFVPAYRQCAEIYCNRGNYSKALEHYQEVIKNGDPEGDVLLHIAICYLRLEKYAAAKKYLQLAEEEDSYNDQIYYAYAECYMAERKWQRAIVHYRQALQLDPLRDEYYLGLAIAYERLGKLQKAGKYYQKAAHEAPDTINNWLAYINFLRKYDSPETALEEIEMASVNTDSPALQYARVACLFCQGKKAEALYFLREALEEGEGSHQLLFEWLPELQQDETVRNVIATFKQLQNTLYDNDNL